MHNQMFRKLWMLTVLAAVGCSGSPVSPEKIAAPDVRPEVKDLLERGAWKRLWIVTGGQTGSDRAAMDVALALALPLRGWCPKDHWSEAGRIEERYPLQDTGSADPAVRTEMNVLDSDGTLVLTLGEAKDGTPLTEQCAEKHGRPLLRFEIEEDPADSDLARFREWIEKHGIRVLNVAGPRESHRPGLVYVRTKLWLETLLKKV